MTQSPPPPYSLPHNLVHSLTLRLCFLHPFEYQYRSCLVLPVVLHFSELHSITVHIFNIPATKEYQEIHLNQSFPDNDDMCIVFPCITLYCTIGLHYNAIQVDHHWELPNEGSGRPQWIYSREYIVLHCTGVDWEMLTPAKRGGWGVFSLKILRFRSQLRLSLLPLPVAIKGQCIRHCAMYDAIVGGDTGVD